jgi:hypothetical protein
VQFENVIVTVGSGFAPPTVIVILMVALVLIVPFALLYSISIFPALGLKEIEVTVKLEPPPWPC